MPIKTTTYPHFQGVASNEALTSSPLGVGVAFDAGILTSPGASPVTAAALAQAFAATVKTVKNGGSADPWNGWDPNGVAIPPRLPDFPDASTTGVFDAAERAGLTTHVGDYTISANDQVVHSLRITGKLIGGNFTGWVVKRCIIEKGTDVSRTTATGAGTFIHCDIGQGAPGSTKINTKGASHFYRCNMFGMLDGLSPSATSGTLVCRDNFVHDLSMQDDATQTPNLRSHNDCSQPKGNGATYHLEHNTFYCWTIDNFYRSETCTRDSGPHWNTTLGTTDSSAGAVWGGYQTSGVLLGTNYSSSKLNLIDNLFRGNANQYIVMRGAGGDCTGNRFASNEQCLSYRPLCIFNETYFDTMSDNRYWDGDPRAGQLIDG